MIIRVLREFHGILTSVTGLTEVRTWVEGVVVVLN